MSVSQCVLACDMRSELVAEMVKATSRREVIRM